MKQQALTQRESKAVKNETHYNKWYIPVEFWKIKKDKQHQKQVTSKKKSKKT